MTDSETSQRGDGAAEPGAAAGGEAGPGEAGPGEAGGRRELHGWPVVESHGQEVVHCRPEGYHDLMAALLEDGFDMCIDLCAVDYLAHAGRDLPPGITPERFEVVVNLLSLTRHRRLRVRVQVPQGDPSVPTLVELWPGAEAMEREAYDMMGIVFNQHPDLTRILMPEDWEGHPLRKDYATGRLPVQFREAPPAR
jgi:NADH-quinone oxidoreductase subunit C